MLAAAAGWVVLLVASPRRSRAMVSKLSVLVAVWPAWFVMRQFARADLPNCVSPGRLLWTITFARVCEVGWTRKVSPRCGYDWK